MRRIVSNTGPLLHLSEIASLDLLRIAGTIEIPTAVDEELDVLQPDWRKSRPDWIQVLSLTPAQQQQADRWTRAGIVHFGEAAALALAQRKRCDWFLTDDAAARLLGATLDLEVHGTLGVVLWAAATTTIERATVDELLTRLRASSLWISDAILVEARAALAKM